MRSFFCKFPAFCGWQRSLLALGLAAAASCPTPASAANIFEALFGIRSQPARVVPAQPSYGRELVIPGTRHHDLNARNKDLRKRKATRATAESSRPQQRPKAVRPPVLTGPLGPFLLDPTLRRGDVVVTTAGLKVFTGGAFNGQHNSREFQALSNATRYVPGNAGLLLSIDRANRFAMPAQTSSQPMHAELPASKPPVVASDPPRAKKGR